MDDVYTGSPKRKKAKKKVKKKQSFFEERFMSSQKKDKERKERKLDMMMSSAWDMSDLSTCSKMKVGAVICNESMVIRSTGFNGVPSNWIHCEEKGVSDEEHSAKYEIHAEINCLCNFTANPGDKETFLFVTHLPCINCAKMIIASKSRIGLSKVYYNRVFEDSEEKYGTSEEIITLLKMSDIEVEKI